MKSLEFDSAGFEDVASWVEQDRAQALRVIRLIRETQRDPFKGIGKPEPRCGMNSRGAGPSGSIGSIGSCIRSCQTKFESWRAAIITD